MSRVGNLRYKGQVRVEVLAGPTVGIVAGTNSGLFTGIAYNGVGNYTLNVTPGTPLPPSLTDGRAVVVGQVEGTGEGSITTAIATPTTITVRAWNDAAPPVAADLPFSLTVREQLIG